MIGCLFIHGFTGGAYEVEPLATYFSERTNWMISIPELPGHGETLCLKGISYQEWIDTAEKELQVLLDKCSIVFVIGFSMGGMIASYLAAKYPIQKLVLLSAAAYYINPKQMLVDIRHMVGDCFRGRLLSNKLFQRYKRKIVATPVSATRQFQRLVKELKIFLPNVKIPTLIIQGECDGIVPKKSAIYLYDNIGSSWKRIHYLAKSKHMVCHDIDKQELFELVEDFLFQEN